MRLTDHLHLTVSTLSFVSLISLGHFLDVCLPSFVMVHYGFGVIFPDDTPSSCLHFPWRFPWLIYVLLWILLQLRDVLPVTVGKTHFSTFSSVTQPVLSTCRLPTLRLKQANILDVLPSLVSLLAEGYGTVDPEVLVEEGVKQAKSTLHFIIDSYKVNEEASLVF